MKIKKKGVGGQKKKDAPVPDGKGVIVAHHGIAVDILYESGERRKVKVKRRVSINRVTYLRIENFIS